MPNEMKPGDKVRVSMNSQFFAGLDGVISGYHKMAEFNGEMVQWYLVQVQENSMSLNYPATWLEKVVRPCPMT